MKSTPSRPFSNKEPLHRTSTAAVPSRGYSPPSVGQRRMHSLISTTNQNQAVLQRLSGVEAFQESTSHFWGKRSKSSVTTIDSALAAYNNLQYDDASKLISLQNLETACNNFLTNRAANHKTSRTEGVKTLKQQIDKEMPFVRALGAAITTGNKAEKLRRLKEADDILLANNRILPNINKAQSKINSLWDEIERDITAMSPDYDVITQEDYVKLKTLAADVTIPSVTRDILLEIVAIVEPLVISGKVLLKTGRSSGAKNIAGDYAITSAARQVAGSSAALASLAHELTHVVVSEVFRNTFMMSISPSDERHIQEEGKARTAWTNALKSAKNSLEGVISSGQRTEINSKLDYMSDYAQLTNYVNKAKGFPVESGVSLVRGKQIIDYVKDSKASDVYNVGNNMVEYDSVLTQLLVLMHQWDVPRGNAFYAKLREVGQDAHNYRRDVASGDVQGGRGRI